MDGRPNWDTITFDVLCPRCDYNLRMRAEPNCPECGRTFDWPSVIDAARRRTQWLFEYHWRQRPFWSWWQTVRQSMNPWRFWQGRSIRDEVRIGPLLCLLAIAQLVSLVLTNGSNVLLFLAYSLVDTVISASSNTPGSAGTLATGFHNAAEMLRASCRAWTHPLYIVMYLVLSIVHLLVLLFSLWLILRRRHVRIGQLLRIEAYNAMPLFVLGFLVHIPLRMSWPWLYSSPLYWLMHSGTAVAGMAVGTLYLSTGLRYYLGVRYAITVAVVGLVAARAASIGLTQLFLWLPRLLAAA